MSNRYYSKSLVSLGPTAQGIGRARIFTVKPTMMHMVYSYTQTLTARLHTSIWCMYCMYPIPQAGGPIEVKHFNYFCLFYRDFEFWKSEISRHGIFNFAHNFDDLGTWKYWGKRKASIWRTCDPGNTKHTLHFYDLQTSTSTLRIHNFCCWLAGY